MTDQTGSNRRASQRYGLSPLRCQAKANRTGEQCKKYAPPGGVTCIKHGGATQAARLKAQARATEGELMSREARLAELMQRPPRSPWEVMTDALSDADAVYLLERQPLLDGVAMSPEQMENYARAMERATQYARAMIKSRQYEDYMKREEKRVRLEVEAVTELIAYVSRGLFLWLKESGLDRERSSQLEEWVGLTIKSGVGMLTAALTGKPDTVQLPDAKPVPVKGVVIVDAETFNAHKAAAAAAAEVLANPAVQAVQPEGEAPPLGGDEPPSPAETPTEIVPDVPFDPPFDEGSKVELTQNREAFRFREPPRSVSPFGPHGRRTVRRR